MSVTIQSQPQGTCTRHLSKASSTVTSVRLQLPDNLPMRDLQGSNVELTRVTDSFQENQLRSDDEEQDSVRLTEDLLAERCDGTGDKASHCLTPLYSDEVPQSSALGGLIAGLLKICIRQKMQSVDTCHVSIGGSNVQLLKGEATSFRVYMKNFCFRGMWNTEAEAHTIDELGVKFKPGSATVGGKLLSRKVPMLISVKLSQEDATRSLQQNDLLRNTLQEAWNHMNGHPLSECQPDGPQSQPKFPLSLPPLSISLEDGLALYREIIPEDKSSEQPQQAARFALRYAIVEVNGLEELQLTEVDWPEGRNDDELHRSTSDESPPLAQSHPPREKWRSIVAFPPDVRFQYFALEKGWFSYSWKFELDL